MEVADVGTSHASLQTFSGWNGQKGQVGFKVRQVLPG